MVRIRLSPAVSLRTFGSGGELPPGTGYYTAIMAHLVGPSGKVTGIELDPGLAERARDNLSSYPDVDVVCGNGAVVPFETADVYADRPRSWFTETPNMPNPS